MSYQLLIVDDEVLIRKALSQYIDWESLNPAMRNLSMHSLQSSTMYPNIC